jgi:hypothetical protein
LEGFATLYVAAGLPSAAAGIGQTSVAVLIDYLFRYVQALSKFPTLTSAPASPVGVALPWVGVRHGNPALAAVAEFGPSRDEITQKTTAR